MNRLPKLAVPLFTATLLTAQIDPRIWRLVGPETKMISGIDLNRCRERELSSSPLCQVQIPYPSSAGQVISMDEKTGARTTSLMILTGLVLAPGKDGQDGQDAPAPTLLDSSTAIVGEEETIKSAKERWTRTDPVSDLARDARQLADSYDAWFLVKKPLQDLGPPSADGKQKFRAEVERVIEEISGGVRFGPSAEVRIEVHTKSADDAFSLAALGRWLPGIIQLMQPDSDGSRILDLAENFEVHASGQTVRLSFNIPEDKLHELAKTFGHRTVE